MLSSSGKLSSGVSRKSQWVFKKHSNYGFSSLKLTDCFRLITDNYSPLNKYSFFRKTEWKIQMNSAVEGGKVGNINFLKKGTKVSMSWWLSSPSTQWLLSKCLLNERRDEWPKWSGNEKLWKQNNPEILRGVITCPNSDQKRLKERADGGFQEELSSFSHKGIEDLFPSCRTWVWMYVALVATSCDLTTIQQVDTVENGDRDSQPDSQCCTDGPFAPGLLVVWANKLSFYLSQFGCHLQPKVSWYWETTKRKSYWWWTQHIIISRCSLIRN